MTADSSPTILLVDDDHTYRDACGSIFRQPGYSVQEATTGDEALRLARQMPDLVVMDVNLPDINGFEVCRRIKTHPATNVIPVLHLSRAFARSEERTHSLLDGADANLAKPVERTELLANVEALLRTRRTENRIRAAARQWKVALDASSDAVCLLDEQGRILRCNKAMARLLGLPFSAIIGQPGQPLIATAFAPSTVPGSSGLAW
jgi:two-component system NtrC family sensor kinase